MTELVVGWRALYVHDNLTSGSTSDKSNLFLAKKLRCFVVCIYLGPVRCYLSSLKMCLRFFQGYSAASQLFSFFNIQLALVVWPIACLYPPRRDPFVAGF